MAISTISTENRAGLVRPFWGRRILPGCVYDVLVSFWLANFLLYILGFVLSEIALRQTALMVGTALIFLARDYLWKGIAFGKHLLGLQVIDTKTGKTPSLIQSVLRNSVLAVPVLLYVIFIDLHFYQHLTVFGLLTEYVNGLVFVYLTILAAVEFVLVAGGTGRRLGDRLAGTSVVRRS